MKRLPALLAITLYITVFIFQISAFAAELTKAAENKDRVSIMADVKIDRKTHGSVVVIAGNIDVQDNVEGDVVVVFGNVNINSRVSRDVVSVFGKTVLTSKAEIGKDVVSIGPVEKSPGARIAGSLVTVNVKPFALFGTISSIVVIISSFIYIVLGLIFIIVFKERCENISRGILEGAAKRFGIGFLLFVGCLILFPFLAITIIAPILFLILMIASSILASFFLGRLILKTFNSESNVYLEFIIGIASIALLKVIVLLSMPLLGFWTSIIVNVLLWIILNSIGLGILIDTRFGATFPDCGSWSGNAHISDSEEEK